MRINLHIALDLHEIMHLNMTTGLWALPWSLLIHCQYSVCCRYPESIGLCILHNVLTGRQSRSRHNTDVANQRASCSFLAS